MSEWISVEDRLPDIGVLVIRRCSNGGDKYCKFDKTSFESGTHLFSSTREQRYLSVTHWMPLPEPPE